MAQAETYKAVVCFHFQNPEIILWINSGYSAEAGEPGNRTEAASIQDARHPSGQLSADTSLLLTSPWMHESPSGAVTRRTLHKADV